VNVPVSEIVVGDRHRRDLGDIDALAASIHDVGLLQPLVLTPDHRLVAGARRLAAVRALGWVKVPVRVVNGLADAVKQLRAERDENVCRKDFTPSEAVAVAATLEALERPEAEKRKKSGTNQHTEPSGKLPEGSKGQVRDKAAGAVGMSGRTLEKAKAVVEAARKNPEKYGKLKEQMDRSGKVNGAFKRLQVARKAEAIAAEPPPLPQGRFRVIVADPPWAYDNRAADASHRAANPYPSMTIEQIKAMKVADMAHEDCILWLWTTNAHLPHAFEIVRAWGFTHKTMLTWVKNSFGTGDWLRGQTEHCILAVRGRPVVTLTNQSTIVRGLLREHSRKPEQFYALVESLCPGSKVELFQRTPREGWAGHGDEVRHVAAGEAPAAGTDPAILVDLQRFDDDFTPMTNSLA
jgi:N6-adenosine-specific RNA methylase IME4/ParB-like chromosome segregation protein Spo0J